jgi:hypothetical protein
VRRRPRRGHHLNTSAPASVANVIVLLPRHQHAKYHPRASLCVVRLCRAALHHLKGRMLTVGRCARGKSRTGAPPRARAAAAPRRAPTHHNDFLWAKILLLHAENLFIDFGAES